MSRPKIGDIVSLEIASDMEHRISRVFSEDEMAWIGITKENLRQVETESILIQLVRQLIHGPTALKPPYTLLFHIEEQEGVGSSWRLEGVAQQVRSIKKD